MKPIYKHLISISSTMAIAIGVVAVLAWVTLQPSSKRSGFNRIFFSKSTAILEASLPQNGELGGISGVTSKGVYLNTKIPGKLLFTDYQLNDTQYVYYNTPKDAKTSSFFFSSLDSSKLTTYACNSRSIIITGPDKPTSTYTFSPGIFTRCVKIGENSYALRAYDNQIKPPDQFFFKWDASNNQIVKEHNISSINGDAGISTDGQLLFDKKSKKLIYVFYFKDQFLCMDTSLNLLYKNHTVDTLTSEIKTGGVSFGNTTTITSMGPKRLINSSSCTFNGKLYVSSKIKSDNESKDTFEANSVIDVYDIARGSYEGSFYLPNQGSERIINFEISDNRITVLFKHHIAIFRYNLTS